MNRIYRLINLVSIDVALGAVACAAMFARIFGVQVRPEGYASLGLVVWCIYTADHLIDAKRIQEPASTQRHRVHQRYFVLFCFLFAAAAISAFFMIGGIRRAVFEAGIVLGLLVGIYFLTQQKLKYFKEAIACVLYCSGVLLPAWSLRTGPVSPGQVVMIILFGLTAFINLILFSWFEWEHDLRHRQSSFAVSFGRERTGVLLRALFGTQVILLITFIMAQGSLLPGLIIVLMNLFLFILFCTPRWSGQEDRYRLYGDAVFFLPAIFLFTS